MAEPVHPQQIAAPPAPVAAEAEARVPLKLDLRSAPSSMEQLAESWRGRR